MRCLTLLLLAGCPASKSDQGIDTACVTTWLDGDGDGYGLAGTDELTCGGVPEGRATQRLDCDDTNPDIHLLAEEVCNGIDDDCDGKVDEGLGGGEMYEDQDGDGYGAGRSEERDCDQLRGWVDDDGDCDDHDEDVHPDAEETCDGVDDDCDGSTDEGLATTTQYRDHDRDGYGDASDPDEVCVGAPGWSENDEDCDDDDDDVHPDAEETCDLDDDDCDGEVDEGYARGTVYQDHDRDGYGDADVVAEGCLDAPGWSTDDTDCDDRDDDIHPGAEESCNEEDDDCDGEVDEDFPVVPWYLDLDWDGYGEPGTGVDGCAPPDSWGWADNADDCLDTDDDTHPGADEVCSDGRDRDCDGLVDCEDDDCATSALCGEDDCADGLDDDDDGYTDCQDDECWGSADCGRVVVTRATSAREIHRGWRQDRDWRSFTCLSSGTYSRGEATRTLGYQASDVEGSVRVYGPDPDATCVGSWGVDRASLRWRQEQDWGRSTSTIFTSTTSARTGFWLDADCSLSSSYPIPPLGSLLGLSAVDRWYSPDYWARGGSAADGGGSPHDCGGSWYYWSNDSSFAYTLEPGARWACTSAGGCALH